MSAFGCCDESPLLTLSGLRALGPCYDRYGLENRLREDTMICLRIAVALALLSMLAGVPSACAETIDTRIGKFELENGYPSKDTAEKLYDEMDFQRATQAYIWALPAVGFHALHLAHLNAFGAKDGDVVLYQSLKDKAGMLTPNITTLYVFSFWNLKDQGPLVLEVPAGATAGG